MMKRPPSNRSRSSSGSITSAPAGGNNINNFYNKSAAKSGRRCLVGLLALLVAQLYLSYTSHHQGNYGGGGGGPTVPSSSTASSSSSSLLYDYWGGDRNRQTTSLSPSQNALMTLLLSEGAAATTMTTTTTTSAKDNKEGAFPAVDGDDDGDDDDNELRSQDEEEAGGDVGSDGQILTPLDVPDADDSGDLIFSSATILEPNNGNGISNSLPSKLQSLAYNHTFPRWGGDPSKNEGIDFRELLRFMLGLVDRQTTTLPADLKDFPDTFPEVIHVWGSMSASPSAWLEKRLRWNRTTVNSIDPLGTDGVYVSEVLRKRTTRRQVRHRVVPVEKFLQRSWTFLAYHATDPAAQKRWPLLLRTMTTNNSGGGFPMIVWHGDYRGCNRYNFERNSSIPLLTTCAHVKCNHSVPFPSYRTIADSLPTAAAWDALFQKEAILYLWRDKISKLVWRGGLTGPLDNFLSPRSRLGIFAAKHKSHPLLDVGIHQIPSRHYHPHSNRTVPWNLAKRIHMKPPLPAANFSHYKAILDTDGNSWSSRFGRLLCTSSVIVKVEPHYVDYFYRSLRPWVHYVPVRHDLSNLLDVVEWVLDDANEDRVLRIVASAQQWCRRHMTYGAIVHDMLDVLNAYVSYLDRGDSEWHALWKEAVERLWDPSSRLDMHKLSHRIPVIRTPFTENALMRLRTNRTGSRSTADTKRRNDTLQVAIANMFSSSSLPGKKGGTKLGRRNKTTTSGATSTKKRPSTYKKKHTTTYRKRLA